MNLLWAHHIELIHVPVLAAILAAGFLAGWRLGSLLRVRERTR